MTDNNRESLKTVKIIDQVQIKMRTKADVRFRGGQMPMLFDTVIVSRRRSTWAF